MRSLFALALFALVWPRVAVGQVPCHAENDGPIFDDSTSMGGPWVAIRFAPPTGFAATRIEVFTGEVLANNTVSLWTHDVVGNQPSTFLGSGSWTVNTTNSWQGGTLAFPVPLTASTTYWLVWIPGGGAQASIDSTQPGLGQVYRASFDNGQTWIGPFQDTVHHWKFRIYGTCQTNPVVFCTSGTTSNGCAATIAASGNPNVAHAASCQITVANVEGQRVGIVFYGLSSLIQPWCSMGGGTSFLCVKTPTARTGVQSTGGAINQCDGVLSLDWNAFQLAHPGALGAPWTAGERAFVQGWFRDPLSCKTTSLTNAVELTYQP